MTGRGAAPAAAGHLLAVFDAATLRYLEGAFLVNERQPLERLGHVVRLAE